VRGKPRPCDEQNPAPLYKTGFLRQESMRRIFRSTFAWKRSHQGSKSQRDEGTMAKCMVNMCETLPAAVDIDVIVMLITIGTSPRVQRAWQATSV
jgi:hypothetical protein